MTARVIPLNGRKRPSHCAAPRRDRPSFIHEWAVNATVMLKIDPGTVPNVVCALWTIDIDAVRRSYEVSVTREGWQHSTIFQGKPQPDETREQALRREGVILFLNELLSASYGVPA
jgi:hypothetical protein